MKTTRILFAAISLWDCCWLDAPNQVQFSMGTIFMKNSEQIGFWCLFENKLPPQQPATIALKCTSSCFCFVLFFLFLNNFHVPFFFSHLMRNLSSLETRLRASMWIVVCAIKVLIAHFADQNTNALSTQSEERRKKNA